MRLDDFSAKKHFLKVAQVRVAYDEQGDANNRGTMELLEGWRRFRQPTLLIWAAQDPHFKPARGQCLLADTPGAVRLEVLPQTGHLLIEERPQRVAELIDAFFTQPLAEQCERARAS